MSEPVNQETYNQEWIDNAWGGEDLESALAQGKLAPRPRVSRALELCDLKPGLLVLDIACGRGEFPLFCRQQGADVIGLDYSDSVLKVAKNLKAVSDGSPNGQGSLNLVQSDACNLPFSSDSFDRISMLDIIEHLTPDQLEAMLRETYRLLKPGGYAVLHTLPNRWVYNVGYKLARLFLRSLPEEPRSDIEKQVHINEQDIVKLANMIGHCNFHYSIWLEQLMPAQSRWQSEERKFHDNRDQMYPLLAGPLGRVLEILSLTPFKLVLSNDIYGVMYKDEGTLSGMARIPTSLTERFACWLGRERK